MKRQCDLVCVCVCVCVCACVCVFVCVYVAPLDDWANGGSADVFFHVCFMF